MTLTGKDNKRLKNKHRGGTNNAKGNSYENFFAVYCIAKYIALFNDNLNDVKISSQLEGKFVDDLLIVYPNNHLVYHQIKNVKDLTWYGDLLSDFGKQNDMSTNDGEDFELKLVYSDSSSKLFPIPENITSCASTYYFPFANNIYSLIYLCPDLKEALKSISSDENVKDDGLLGIAKTILGEWCAIEQHDVSLQQIIDDVEKIGKGYIPIKTSSEITISDRSKEILNTYNLDYHLNGDILYWNVHDSSLRGNLEWTKEKEINIENSHFNDMWDLISILN